MSNQNLLGLAAKAAGLELDWDVPDGASPWVITGEGSDRGPSAPWNPLEDDGDALRLAVDLEISIGHDRQKPNTNEPFSMRYADAIGPVPHNGSTVACGSDPFKAMRRAIVSAAAEIGKAM